MRVLIIEDDMNKLSQLKEFIECKFPNSLFAEKYSYQSGLREVMICHYDLIILDMSLPTFDKTPQEPGGRPRSFAGKEILRRMQKKEITMPVIVVTQFDKFGETNIITLNQLSKDLEESFPGIFFGLVYYSAALMNWTDDLDNLLNELSNFISLRQEEIV